MYIKIMNYYIGHIPVKAKISIESDPLISNNDTIQV